MAIQGQRLCIACASVVGLALSVWAGLFLCRCVCGGSVTFPVPKRSCNRIRHVERVGHNSERKLPFSPSLGLFLCFTTSFIFLTLNLCLKPVPIFLESALLRWVRVPENSAPPPSSKQKGGIRSGIFGQKAVGIHSVVFRGSVCLVFWFCSSPLVWHYCQCALSCPMFSFKHREGNCFRPSAKVRRCSPRNLHPLGSISVLNLGFVRPAKHLLMRHKGERQWRKYTE